MDHTYPVEQQIRHLRGDIPELDTFRQEFHTLLDAADIRLEVALMVARNVVERFVNTLVQREGFTASDNLCSNIETLGSSDEKSAKRRGGRPPCLPGHLHSHLHDLRIHGNAVVHPFEPGSTMPKSLTLHDRDLDLVLRQLLRLLEWLFTEYPGGPRLETVFDPGPEEPALALAEQQGHLSGFVGRDDELAQARAWIDSPGSGYLLWLGPPGQGKSALMAELARRESSSQRGGCVWHMIKSQNDPARFVPALLGQAARLAKTSFPPEASRGDLRQLRSSLSDALRTLQQRTGRAVLLIDALDELVAGDEQRAYDPRIEFLPEVLPEGVRAVLTCRPDIPLVNALRARLRGLVEREVPQLSVADFRRLLEARMDETARRAVEDTIGVEAVFARLDGNSLLLRQTVERLAELARQAAAEGRPLRLTWDELPTSLEAMFRQVYNRIGEREGTRWTSTEGRQKARLLQFLCVAREELGYGELAELLTTDGTMLSLEDCRDRVDEMSQYLLNVGGCFKPWHQGLTDHVRQHILGAVGVEQAEDVYCRWLGRGRGGQYGLRHRARHLVAAGRPAEAYTLLTDLPELEARVRAGLAFEVAADLGLTAQSLPAGRERRILELLEEALRRDIQFIDRHRQDYPQGLFQCLFNSLWWYDCPQAALHYAEGRSPGQQAGLGLHELAQSWRQQRQQQQPGFLWLRSLRPPSIHLGTALRAVLRGHKRPVRSVAISGDGRRLVSGSYDNTVRVWDAASGVELLCLQAHEDWVNSVAISGDGRRLVSSSYDNAVCVWDAASGVQLLCLRPELRVSRVAISGDGRLLVSELFDKTVRVWDAVNGACLEVHQGLEHFDRLAGPQGPASLCARTEGLDSCLVHAGQGPRAWFPTALDRLTTTPSGRLWTGASGNYVALFALEGDL
jgi:hypothetical protein